MLSCCRSERQKISRIEMRVTSLAADHGISKIGYKLEVGKSRIVMRSLIAFISNHSIEV